ncbi:hypothetical protein RB623_27090 [Mesorhizobium sp. LHD-90]|uniref:hypothetical protein n=1 Tax=Mesorhizobium sp. LHD-90 TaxID=3071414 RepID=UPI0027E1C640|nr:hypothetical protein [Mesorhizobium sp. LHD-90]MDQ6437734.1 hypothetical protein [Mesorhizobium sp. LHD-90]
MKRTRLIIALAVLLAAPTAAKTDSPTVNAIAFVISLAPVVGGIEERREQKPFETYDLCLAWKRQKEVLPPDPPALLSFVYCEQTEAPPTSS